MGSSSLAHWADVQSTMSPKFGVNSTASITPDFQKRPLSTESEFRVAFSFSLHRFETDFIQIADGVGGFAKEIVFDIQFKAHDVQAVDHRVVYFDPAPRSPPEAVMLRYLWRELPSPDPEYGFFFVFLIGTLTAVLGASAYFFGRVNHEKQR